MAMSVSSPNDSRTASPQPGILTPTLPVGRSLTFRLVAGGDPGGALARLRATFAIDDGVVGIGVPVTRALGRELQALRIFPALAGPGVTVPSTQQAVWIFLRAIERGLIFDATERVRDALSGGFALHDALDTFIYRGGRDLTGFEDGTENPQGDLARAAAIAGSGAGLAGSSFVAVQRWIHDLERFRSFPGDCRDAIVGRRADTNVEIADAPSSAHVKRTAQESFDPAAFMVRRSMPFATDASHGLEFIAYGESLDRFERVMTRMVGLEDGVVDGLFSFSRPVTGGYYWCPPVAVGRLDLSFLGIR